MSMALVIMSLLSTVPLVVVTTVLCSVDVAVVVVVDSVAVVMEG